MVPSLPTGTTVDAFLRENLEWLSRATNWAKFSATAGLGVIHRQAHLQGKRGGGRGQGRAVGRGRWGLLAHQCNRFGLMRCLACPNPHPHLPLCPPSCPTLLPLPPSPVPVPLSLSPPPPACRGHLEQGKTLMGPYLPRNTGTGSPYSEGGAL